MVTCHNCGSELTGKYCNTCGERAQEEVSPASRKQRKAGPMERGAEAPSHKPAPRAAARPVARPRPSDRAPGGLTPQLVTRTTALGLLGLALFGSGMIAGFYLAQSPSFSSGGPLTSTTVEAQGQSDGSGATINLADPDAELPPLARAGILLDQGVEYMQRNSRPAATDKFRKAAGEYDKVLKEDPDNLYARSYLGLVYFYLGDNDKAFDHERKVLDKDPNYLWVIFNLAWMYEATGKKTESVLMYKRYADAAPKEKENKVKYAEQYDLIDKQLETAKKQAAGGVQGGEGQ